ncbi:glycine N-acyltransferase-like protein 3 [Engraulis encrasicolus]|uniref:glycine N-acyltransferase-like protein 3 n=1 Tax=Engraulis encrasicolus TaxID=184585 RepID=UPI002FD4BD8C
MKVLDLEEIQTAEQILRRHLPKSSKVHGYLIGLSRNKPSTYEVVVDAWPDFTCVILRPDQQNPNVSYYQRKVTLFCTETGLQVLKRMIAEEEAIDWSAHFMIGGLDMSLAPMVKEVAASKGVNVRYYTLVQLVVLSDPRDLPQLTDNRLESRISSLTESHIDLVNKTWKFGGDEKGYNIVKNLIRNFPSYCIVDDSNQPVSWMLLYDYCALGLLYTMPEHRGKGYAKTLITHMSKQLHAQGYPVYCFIEEDNAASLRLFRSLGFTEHPSYRVAWFEFNY